MKVDRFDDRLMKGDVRAAWNGLLEKRKPFNGDPLKGFLLWRAAEKGGLYAVLGQRHLKNAKSPWFSG